MAGQLPQPFGKYTLVERIATGGMAEIYRAWASVAGGPDKDVCIKRILERFSADEEFVRMFTDEARLTLRLQHDNIVQVFDFDVVQLESGPSYYIAMELIEGKDLRLLMREGARKQRFFTLGQSVYIACEVAKGLHYAHARVDGGKALAIVHRDVSPHNVLLSTSGAVKLSDFGIARAAERASATSNGMIKGKLAYMSPEQVTGQPLDHRTDVFSLGIVLYELATRTRLFAGDSEIEVIGRVRDGLVPAPRSRNPDIPADLDDVLARMLARHPKDRYATAADAARALAATSVYSAAEATTIGAFVAEIFPPAPAAARSLAAASRDAPSMRLEEKKNTMSNSDNPKPPGGHSNDPLTGAATMMMEAPVIPAAKPAAAPVTEQKTAILDTASPQGAALQAQIEAARAKVAAASAPAAAPPVTEAKTAILDVASPQGAALQAQIEAARAKVAAAAAAPVITEQKTAILDVSSAQGAALQAHIEAARGAKPSGPVFTEQKTAILDTASPQGAALQAQVEAARARGAGGGGAAPPPGEQRTMIFDTGAQGGGGAAGGGGGAQRTVAFDATAQPRIAPTPMSRPQHQQLAPMPPPRQPKTWVRWVIGPALMLVTAGVTYAASNALFPPGPDKTPPEPPKIVEKGRIKVTTTPPGASVNVEGKPHPHFTPTTIEGPIGQTPAHVKITMGGYEPHEVDVLFSKTDQSLQVTLTPEPPGARKPRPATPSSGTATPTPSAGTRPDRPAKVEMAPVADKGTIGIFVQPWATVAIDGKPAGQTPLGAVTLTAGKHTIELANDKLGRREKITVTIKGGENPELRRDWRQ